jgi:Undecaprenyl-phosphate galactose phosphotransferase WbaP
MSKILHSLKNYSKPSLTLPFLCVFVLLISDFLALIFSVSISFALYRILGIDVNLLFEPYKNMQPAPILFVICFAMLGLYPAFAMGAVEELRRIFYGTLTVYLTLAASTFFIRGGEDFSRGIFLFLLLFSLILLPLFRALTRELFSTKPWWGANVLILGAAKTGQMLVEQLIKFRSLGLKPVAFLDDDVTKHGHVFSGIHVAGALDHSNAYFLRGVKWMLVAMPGLSSHQLNVIIRKYGYNFRHVVIFPDIFGLSSLWVSAKDFGGILGLEIRQQLLLPFPVFTKRFLDLCISIPLFILLLPLLLFVCLLIIIESRGNPIFFQERLGKNGTKFKVIKLRTMYRDSQDRLKSLFVENPHLKIEYEKYAKLKNDPRISKVGKILRKLSIDELPQILNVMKGEMSLVGPRAYLISEQSKVGEQANLILRVVPGITGLWQVSGRSQLTFDERVQIESYYVQNWSIWLDLCILARTVWVVFLQKGAY